MTKDELLGALAVRSPRLRLGLRLACALEIERHRSAERSFNAASSTLSLSWISMARTDVKARET
jgi:hypothetical protein